MQSLSYLIHGNAKIGKSTLASTSPPPICVFDCEGSWKFIKALGKVRCIDWDPTRYLAPEYDGTWDAAIVNVDNFDTFKAGYERLVTGQHTFRSVVVDSITQLQKNLKNSIVGDEALQWEHWGQLLRKMEVVTLGLRDLTQHPINPMLTAVFVCETKLRDDKWKPKLEGGIADSAPYWFDIVGYYWVEPKLDSANLQVIDPNTGRKLKNRKLLISPDNPLIEAGSRVQELLPDIIEEPNVSSMLVSVFPELAAPQTTGE